MVELAKVEQEGLTERTGALAHLFPTKSYVYSLTLFWISLFGLSIGYVFSLTTFSLTSAYQALQLASIALLFFSLTKLIKINFSFTYFRLIGFIYILWQVIIL